MPQVMQGPVGAERGAGAAEHPVGGVVAQLAEGSAQCPPQRIIRPSANQAVHLRLIQPQPHERIRGSRQLLQVPGPLADDRDQLLPGVGVPARRGEQFRRPRPGGHPERDQRAVPVRAQGGEQLIELLLRDVMRRLAGKPGPV